MKLHHITRSVLIAAGVSLGFVSTLAAAVVAGPKGGRLLQATPHQAEFFVTTDGIAEVVFYDDAMTPVGPGTQAVAVIADAPAGRTPLEMVATPTGFQSAQPLPDGAPYRVVVQLRATPAAKPQNFRIELNLTECGGCSHAEYACTCEGH